jgi:hypothetical protein
MYVYSGWVKIPVAGRYNLLKKEAMTRLLLLLFLLATTSVAKAQGFMWISHFGGSGQCIPVDVQPDPSGNLYVVGMYTGTMTERTTSLTSVGNSDVFLAKYSTGGSLLWIKSIGSTGADNVVNVAINKEGTGVFISGMYTGTCSFGGGYQLTSAGMSDLYIARFDSDGNVVWVVNSAYGLKNQQYGNIAVDDSGNLIQVGSFYESVTFSGGSVTLTSPAALVRQQYLAKFDGSGALIWAKMITGDNSNNTFRTVRASGNDYYISGVFQGSLNFDVGTVSNTGLDLDAFLYKTNSSGTGQWVRKIKGGSEEMAWRHVADENQNQYIVGYFSSSLVSIDSTSSILSQKTVSSQGGNDILVVQYNSAGTLQSIETYGSSGDDLSYSGSAANNNLVISGSSDNSLTFGSLSFVTEGNKDAFVVKKSGGSYTTLIQSLGKGSDIAKATGISKSGNNYYLAAEYYSDSLELGDSLFINSTTSTRDGYVMRYGCFDSVSAVITPVTCVDGGGIPSDDGTLSATASEGSGPYTYAWSNGSTAANLTGLAQGNYTVTVSGKYGCTVSRTFTVGLVPSVSAIISASTNVTCNGGSNGTATVNASNGKAPYLYLWSNGATTSTVTNLSAGTSYVTVTDQCGNQVIQSVAITQPSVLTASVNRTNIVCRGAANGTATAVPSNGTSPYTYLWSTGATTVQITGLAPGSYSVTITDACGATKVISTTISQPGALSATISSTPLSCSGGSTGTATVVPSQGTSPYTYLWSTGGTTATITGLAAGNYSVTVSDACGATIVQSTSIASPAVLKVTLVSTKTNPCDSTGTVTSTVSGGTPPYSYLWSNGATSAHLTDVPADTYTVTVTDFCGNTATRSSIVKNNRIRISATTVCSSSCNGTAKANVSGGDPPYTYLWNDPTSQTTQTATHLCAGTYRVTVTDALGCTKVKTNIKVNNCAKSTSIEPEDSEEVMSNLALFPNPSSDKVSVQISIKDEGSVYVEWMNVLGKVIGVSEVKYGNDLLFEFSVADLPPGLYLVKVITPDEVYTRPLVVE